MEQPRTFKEALPMGFALLMSARLSEMGIKNSEIKDVKLGSNNFFVELEGIKGKFFWKKHYFVRFIFNDYRNPKVYDIVTRRIYK
ncbi:hypothetical protein 276BB001_7 [Bacillus phage 276BB001]|nr:hypothetical protein 276BB001_7 [Bacillus phage 276BB001]QFG05928.1 hypothetical protein 280BB001_7 [Bacillus phage 280BB001]QZA70077.1 hypothetical protein 274BB002_7 [Bacillus phage 274BB002]